MMEQFVKEENIQINNTQAVLDLKNLDVAVQDPSTQEVIKKYTEYENKVEHGHLGETAAFLAVNHQSLPPFL